MAEKKYKVIVSDRAKQMLGIHIRFMAQVNKDAAIAKKNRHLLLSDDSYIFDSVLMNEPTIILAAIKNILHIHCVIFDLIKNKIPFFNKHLVILI